jgi:putative mycofactocin binding protein MftB
MVSAASTENATALRYVVPGAVRARREDFGLLFYDTRTTKLTFVRSGERLALAPRSPAGERELLLRGEGGRDASLTRLLQTLLEKGLVRALAGSD